MSGLFGLLDDVAALAKLAAASVDDVGAAAGRAGAKAAGVVVDDTAVTPQYVHGVAANRELPIIKRIAVGSLRNKLLFILPAALLLSQFLPWAVTVLLMLGATYLCFEGTEKAWHGLRPHRRADDHHAGGRGGGPVAGTDAEATVVRGAIRTDFILSAEIMVIALKEVEDEGFLSRAAILGVVAVGITLLVYGVVALIVKMDDAGLALARRGSAAAQRLGRALVRGMPALLRVVSLVGVAAMLWVGGYILLASLDELGWRAPYDLVSEWEKGVREAVPALGGVLGWSVSTLASAVLGLLVGAVVVAVVTLVHRVRSGRRTTAAS